MGNMDWIRKFLYADSIQDAFNVLINAGRYMGGVPYNVVNQNGKFVTKLDPWGSVFMFSCFGVYGVCAFVVIVKNETIIGLIFSSALFRVSDRFRMTVGFTFIAYTMIHTIIERRFYGKILNLYCKIDELFKAIGGNNCYTTIKTQIIVKCLLYEMCTSIYMILSIILVSSWQQKPSFAMNVVMYGPGFVVSTILMIFNTNVSIVNNHLAFLNEKIAKRNHAKSNMKLSKNVAEKNHFNTLHMIMKIYDTVCHAADIVNCHFTKIILVIMATSFVSVVFNAFYVLMTVKQLVEGNVIGKLTTFLFFSLHQCFLHCTNIILAVNSCDSCERETEWPLMGRRSNSINANMIWPNFLFEAKNIKDAMTPLIWMGKCFGLIIHDLSEVKGSFKLKLNVFFLFYSLLSASLCATCFIVVIYSGETVTSFMFYSDFFKIIEEVKTVTEFCVFLFISVNTFIEKDFYLNMLNNLINVDQLFMQIGIRKDYKKWRTRLVIIIFTYHIYHASYFLISFYFMSAWNRTPSLYLSLCSSVPSYMIMLTMIVYVAGVKTIEMNLKELNDQVKKLIERKPPSKMNFVSPDLLRMEYAATSKLRLQILMKIYDTLCQSSDIINDHFSKIILSIVNLSFITIVTNMFYIFNTIVRLMVQSGHDKLLFSLAYFIHHSTLFINNITVLIIICDNCTEEAKKTSILTNKMLIQEENEEIIKKLHQFSTYMLHRVPRFSACGFFPVDNTLFFTMVGAATTYLIILIQFALSATLDEFDMQPGLNQTEIT